MSTRTHIYVGMKPSLQRDAKKLAHRRETTLSGLIRSLIEDAVQIQLETEQAAFHDQLKREREKARVAFIPHC